MISSSTRDSGCRAPGTVEPHPALGALERGEPPRQLGLDLGLGLVGLAPHDRALGRRQGRDRPEKLRQEPPLAEVADPDLLEVLAGGGALQLLGRPLDDRADAPVRHGSHILPDSKWAQKGAG
jgi:hypothetical protein